MKDEQKSLIDQLKEVTKDIDATAAEELADNIHEELVGAEVQWCAIVGAIRGGIDAAAEVAKNLLPDWEMVIGVHPEEGPWAMMVRKDNMRSSEAAHPMPGTALLIATLQVVFSLEEFLAW